ncbi:MAG: hypothetical protein AUI08_11795 [Gemmatimonadetes bacterium 13_2_20CM_2_65_7]|nr:MAG: hypothetical protein AUI08_11795 [Gemmatimonadetes bacterium 13_2_20CM_2_65_7]OLC99300.1 MAG: hypothetical protein AUI89_09110 [Gemmatimonadetes bacterium 13_1_40CM_3_65_8]
MRLRRAFAIVAALPIALAAYGAWSAVPAQRPVLPLAWTTLPRASITADAKRRELVLELPSVDLPAGAAHDIPPASLGEFPVNASIYAFHAELRDQDGRLLPADLLHHMNVMDPAERELFLPIARRILASGRETGEIRFPWLLFGARVRAGERIIANAMLHNTTPVSYRGVRVRLVLSYVPDGRPWPFFSVFPWQLDVAFPVGDKSFDLSPGHSERSYEGSPAVDGKIVVIGGHMHEYGRTIEFWDVTTGTLLWHGEPAPAPPGEASPVPLGRFYGLTGIGLPIMASHRYRVRVVYENPTGHTIAAGGMGVVGGLFIPRRGAVWPSAEPSDSLYQLDVRHFMGLTGGGMSGMEGMGEMGGMDSHDHDHGSTP